MGLNGSVSKLLYYFDNSYDELCFEVSKNIALKHNGNNEFVFRESNVYVDSDFCIKINEGRIVLKFESLGDHVKVSEWKE